MAKTPLKDQNVWKLWAVLAANAVFLYAVVQANAIAVDGLRAIFADPHQLAPVGIAVVVATVVNAFLRPETKARLVFLRWRYALPGHRAFSRLAEADPRIDLGALERLHGAPLPVDPAEENRVWYRMYKTVENEPAVLQSHRDFLFLRDYASMAVLLLIVFSVAGLYAIASLRIALTYGLLLLLQYAVVRHAAANTGVRMVTTVLAIKAAAPVASASARRRAARQTV
jgi:hypothetical protein